ncbi:PKD domain-containing protein [uncultured Pseudokineococcus sp.]|uniref:PKD domain-containing protein n=1 Tax=uncultured Pseudokineococcus sp. TaxID=1642928 RepID=UPI002622E90B|nr:PKD domain-containing protein [uncultured Pseudokineococcus sp.]
MPTTGGGATTAAPVAEDPFIYRYVPGCSGNDANGGGDGDCTATRAACPPGQLMFFVWRAPAAGGVATGDFTQTGRQCMVPPQPGEPGAADADEPLELPGMTQADFQRLPLPAGTSTVQPATGEVLLNMPTNTYAQAEPVELGTDLLGFPVTVRATPAAYTWDYGDGTTVGPTTDPGAPWPDLRVTHTYETAGTYAITLTTHYTGEYSILGGPYLPIPGQAQVTSEPQEVVTYQGSNVPVADALG